MSFVPTTVFTNTSRLHEGKGVARGSGGLLTPLFQLVKDPYGTIVGTTAQQEAQATRDEQGRRQVLCLRMKNVGTSPCLPHSQANARVGGIIRRMESGCLGAGHARRQ